MSQTASFPAEGSGTVPGPAIVQMATFLLGAEEYAIEIGHIQEIVRMLPVTRVPRAPTFIEGVVNLRGKIVPVIDLRKRFGLEPFQPTKATRIIIINVEAKTVGLVVDAVKEVLRLETSAISPPPELVSGGVDEAFIQAVGRVGGRLIIMLDVGRLLSRDEVATLRHDMSEPTTEVPSP